MKGRCCSFLLSSATFLHVSNPVTILRNGWIREGMVTIEVL